MLWSVDLWPLAKVDQPWANIIGVQFNYFIDKLFVWRIQWIPTMGADSMARWEISSTVLTMDDCSSGKCWGLRNCDYMVLEKGYVLWSISFMRNSFCQHGMWPTLLLGSRRCATHGLDLSDCDMQCIWKDGSSIVVGHIGYLVDSASSHMLVSKIKPCMSKYKQIYCETANGSLNQLLFIWWLLTTWITVVILELIHAKAPTFGGVCLLDKKPMPFLGSLVIHDNLT